MKSIKNRIIQIKKQRLDAFCLFCFVLIVLSSNTIIYSSEIETHNSARIIYVDDNAPGYNNGMSWNNAYIYLQDALYDANSSAKPVEIKVAQGIYTPNKGTHVTNVGCDTSFELINGVTISGGYAGFVEDEVQVEPNARNIELYQTILSGDLENNDTIDFDPNNRVNDPNFWDNSFHVLYGSFIDDTCVLDGLIIKSGTAGWEYTSYNATSRGGGIFLESSNNGPIINNCTFTINAAYLGGAIYNLYSDPNISNCKFIQNSANYYYSDDPDDDEHPNGGLGGTIFNFQSSPTLTNCEFIDNLASSGAGIYNFLNSNSIITKCNFTLNESNLDCGGGIFNYKSNPFIQDCNFYENIAVNYGGAIANDSYCNPVIDNCNFELNFSKISGGAIYNIYYCEPNITNCIFENNSTFNIGGAIANETSGLTITNCTFTGNFSSYGGALYNYSELDTNNVILSSCIFSNNSSISTSGAINNLLGSLELNNCILSGNYAQYSAGALQNTGGNVKANNCTITGNYAEKFSDAVHNETFFYTSEDYPYHTTIIYGSIDIINCIIWNGPNAILNTEGSDIYVSYSNIFGGKSAIDSPADNLIWGDGNINIEPLFANDGYWLDVNDPNIIVEPNDPNAFWLEGDYHLQSSAGRYDPNSQIWISDDVNSPCIDTGDPNSSFENEPLPNGGRINIGAYGGTTQASLSLESPAANKESDISEDF